MATTERDYMTINSINAGMQGTYAGVATEKPRGPFDNLQEALSILRNVKNRTSALADQLVGSQPEQQKEGGTAAIGNGGLFMIIDSSAEAVRSLASEIADNLNRIERRL